MSSAFATRQSPLATCVVALLIFAVTCSVFPSLAAAQTENATISGRVTDSSGAIIVHAVVELTSAERGTMDKTITNDAGIYVFSSIRPGIYHLRVRKDGFKTEDYVGLVANVQDHLEQNFRLTVGAVSESITVRADQNNVNTNDASVSTTVDRTFVENMPLNGRSFQSLIELTPGIVNAKTSYNGTGGQFSADGQRSDSNYYTIDGTSANVGVQTMSASLGSTGGGALPATSAAGGFNNLVSVDAMEEFKIQTSTYAPEFGRTPGAQISIVTRSGSNQFHGTAFDYLRNTIFDARDWFTNYYGLPKPAEKQNDFGGVLGGPILKNRLFFFFSYEGLRLRQPQTKSELDPSPAARAAAPASIQPILDAFPVPTIDNGPFTGTFAGSYSNPSTLNATSIRVDYAATSKISIFGRYNHAPSESDEQGSDNYYSLSTLARTVSNVDTFTAGATITFKPTLLNEFRFNYSHSLGTLEIAATNFGGAVVPPDSYLFNGYPEANSKKDAFFAIFTPDFNGLEIGGSGYTHTQTQLNFIDSITWTLGSHNIKSGVDYRRLTPYDGYWPYYTFSQFNGVAGALTGLTEYSFVSSADSGLVKPLFTNLSLFSQDTWKATPNLTVTYGVRWDYNPPPTSRSSYPIYTPINLNDPPNAALGPNGTPLWNATHANFAPRLGVAYNLRRTPGRELVLRGGAGIFYDLGNNYSAEGILGFPYFRSNFFGPTPYPLNAAENAPVPFTLNPPYSYMYGFLPNLKLPRTYEWNFSLQQSLGANQSVTATYVGSAGRDLLRNEGLTPNLGLNPNFSPYITVTTNDGYSNYDALQLQFQRHLSHGLQVLVSYNFAHALDNSSTQTLLVPYHTVYNPAWDYGNSDFDIRHSFSTALTYNLPTPGKSELIRAVAGHWAVDSLFRANSALPIFVTTGLDPYNLTTGSYNPYLRPDVVPGQPFYLYGSQYPGGMAINPAAFQNPPASAVQGNLARNVVRGFGAWEEDFTLRREFPIHESVKLQFRAEFFNIFNHPLFGDPGTQNSLGNVISNPRFGLSLTTLAQSFWAGGGTGSFNPLYQIGGPRSIQLAMKLIF